MELKDRLKAARAHAKLNQTETAKRANVDQATISNLERGKHHGSSHLVKIAHALGVDPHWLATGQGEMLASGSLAAKIESNVGPAPKMEGYVPVISWVQAGAWTEVDNVEIIPEEYVPRPPGASDRTFALRVRGQSMLPKYEPGLIIYVDPEVLPFDGDDVVAMLNQHGECEATFKQLVEEPGMRLLKARNPAWPDPWIEINGRCEIIGVVIGALWLRAPR